MKKKALLEKRAALLTEETAQLQRLNAAETPLSGDEQTAYNARRTELSAIDDQLAGITRLEEATRISAASLPRVEVRERLEDKPWESLGEQLQAVAFAAMPGQKFDPRLQTLAPTGGSAQVATDGGFLIHNQFATEIWQRTYDTAALANRCKRTAVGEGFDGLELPYLEETSRVTGSRYGGVQAYWAAETDAAAAQRPKIGLLETRLMELKGLAYATNRLLRDAVAMTSIYKDAFANEFAFALDDAIFRGDGIGKPLGIKTAAATVSVAKESGQTNTTIVQANIAKMYGRMWPKSLQNSVWFINQDCQQQLWQMSTAVVTSGASVPIYLPPGGMSAAPYGTLMGRPVIPIEQCDTLGTVGDIVLADLSQYILIDKGGMVGAESMHVRFIYDEMTFKFNMRVNGQPLWKTALTPYKGSNTLSPFITLASRP